MAQHNNSLDFQHFHFQSADCLKSGAHGCLQTLGSLLLCCACRDPWVSLLSVFFQSLTRCPTGVRSNDWLGHLKTSNFFTITNSSVTFRTCFSSLSTFSEVSSQFCCVSTCIHSCVVYCPSSILWFVTSSVKDHANKYKSNNKINYMWSKIYNKMTSMHKGKLIT